MVHSYISVDLETTGLNPKMDKIIEIGLVKVINDQMVSTYSKLLNPRRDLTGKIKELTGITDDMLTDAPSMDEILKEVLEFCQDLPFLGHHVIFDYSFLKRATINRGLELQNQGMDTLTLCRLFMPEGEKKNLSAACSFFDIEMEEAHRALSDALASHKLYQTLYLHFGQGSEEAFSTKSLIYKVKKEQPASKRQKEYLRDLLKYHRISLTVQIDYLSRNEISRFTDKIISQYGRNQKR